MERLGGGDLSFAGLARGAEGDARIGAVEEIGLPGIRGKAERGCDPDGGRGVWAHCGRDGWNSLQRRPSPLPTSEPGDAFFVASHFWHRLRRGWFLPPRGPKPTWAAGAPKE